MWIEWLTNTITMHRSLLILYQDWYYQLETDMCARMSQSCMEELEQKLIEGRTTFSATAEAIHQIERELSPYMDAGSFYSRGVDGAYETAQNVVTTLKTAIGEYEEYHKNNDFSYTNEMLESMGRIIQGQLRGSGANIRNYQPGSLKQTEAYQKAGAVNRMQEMYIGLVKEEVEASEANYVERKEAWEEELRKRKEQELIHIIEGIGIMIVGTYVTITTMGAGLPMVVTAAEVVLGSTATVYGASNNMEALSNLYQAMGGDARSTAFNPIRDTIFASNPELYYKIGNTATMLTVLSLPVGMSMEAAVAVGGSPLWAGITELGKFGISTMAGEVTTDKVTEWTGSEALGIIAGMGTSSLSYGGLSAVDYKVNISGLHGTGGNTRIGNVTGSGKSGSGSIGEGIESGTETSRPTWRQSELDAAKDFPDYDAQKSFINGEEVPYGTKGSVRPDYYKDGYSVDIKNYNVESASGRSNLARNIEKQYYQRIENLPEGTKQSVMIDIRGQNVTDADLSALYDDIMKRTDNGVEILFKMD